MKEKTSGRILVPTYEGEQWEHVNDITYCEANGNCTWINFSGSERLLTTHGLSAVERMIGNENFIRCHKSILANFEHVKKISFKEKALILVNGERIEVSRRKMKVVKAFMREDTGDISTCHIE